MTKKRMERQAAIRAIVRAGGVRTQRGLAEALVKQGYRCTQATVSRDIADMGMHKGDSGTYVLPEDEQMHRALVKCARGVFRSDLFVFIRVLEGCDADAVASTVSDIGHKHIKGVLPGGDTVMVVFDDAVSAEQFELFARQTIQAR